VRQIRNVALAIVPYVNHRDTEETETHGDQKVERHQARTLASLSEPVVNPNNRNQPYQT
jgi:hypothetical protein